MSKKNNNNMMTETPISLCGRELYFKRCPNSTIKVYDEKIRDKAKSIEPVQREVERLQEDVELLEKKLANVERMVEFIDKKEEPTDEELDKANKLLEQQDELYTELKEARQKVSDYSEEQNDTFTKIDEEMKALLGEKVEAMLDGITKEEFIEENDVVDIRIATNLSKYYELCIIGERPKKIQEEIKRDSRVFNDMTDSFH